MTGGAGFIGSHVTERLVNTGHKVRVIDNLSTGKLENIKDHADKRDVSFIKGDIRKTEDIKKCTSSVDVVIHLAAITSVPFSVKHPNLTRNTNETGTLNLLKTCLKEKVKKFIFISSCAIYGEPEYLPIDEKHPTAPMSPYASTKLTAEQHCRKYQKKHNLNMIILRLFNVYGSRQGTSGYRGVINEFMERAKRNLPLIIHGDGSQTRDFVHVHDVTDAIHKTLEISDGTFNIGSGKSTSINRLAETVKEITRKDLRIIHKEPRSGDLKHSWADISKAEEILDYQPKTSLKKGLQTLLSATERKD